MIVNGVSADREQNDANVDYLYVDNAENNGIRVYLHKYFLGMHSYYLQRESEDLLNKAENMEDKTIDEYFELKDDIRDQFFRQKKEMLERNYSSILRITLLLKN
jgi:hypothetical protein